MGNDFVGRDVNSAPGSALVGEVSPAFCALQGAQIKTAWAVFVCFWPLRGAWSGQAPSRPPQKDVVRWRFKAALGRPPSGQHRSFLCGGTLRGTSPFDLSGPGEGFVSTEWRGFLHISPTSGPASRGPEAGVSPLPGRPCNSYSRSLPLMPPW